jgi:hypothetical protein
MFGGAMIVVVTGVLLVMVKDAETRPVPPWIEPFATLVGRC